MKTRTKSILKPLSLRLESLENRELLSAAPWSARVDALDAQIVETASAKLEQNDVIDLANAQIEDSVSDYSGDYTIETNYDPAAKKLQVVAPEVDGAVAYYLWKPAPKSGNMAIYQRCSNPVFTVSNLQPGQTTDFRVSAYDSKGAVLKTEEFQFASVSLDAPKTYRAGNALDVTVGADASLSYDLSWRYVTESGDVEISEAKGMTSFVPDAATYPIKIVATPIADTEGLYVCDPVETIVEPFNALLENSVSFANTGVTNNQYSLSWDPIDGASTYSVKINRDGAWIQYNKGLTDTSCVINGLYAGNTYEIRVCAVNENGRLTGDYIQTSFAPVRIVRSVNKFVGGDELGVSVIGSDDASCDIAWYYATPDGDVEITEACGLLTYAPENPQYDVKVVATGTGLSEGSVSETLFVYSGDQTVETNYDPELKKLQIVTPEVDGAAKYYIWKPAPSGNMAIYQRTTEPVFTVSNVYPGTTTDFRVSAYDAKGKVLDSIDFKFASVALNAPERYKAGNSIDVVVRADASLNYDLSWRYVTEAGDVEITEAKGLTSFTPDAATYPIKIVATPIADAVGLCVGGPVEAIVDPYVPQFGLNDPYVTTKRSFVTTWGAVPDATRYAVQKLNANGEWVKM
ncbi:MAG: fibronectin type III domain-containing protein, partial [Thermoguttaceae bacterium]